MTLNKDTIIKAILKGIYISITFNEFGELIDFKELNTNYLKDISLNTIQQIVNNKKCKTSGTYKACLTIEQDDIYKCCNLENINDNFKEIIYSCINDINRINLIKFVICGLIDDTEEYDEMYNCILCPLFSEFKVSPKMKLKFDVNHEDIISILTQWLKVYIFDSILIRTSEDKYEFKIYELCDKYIFNKEDIRYSSNVLFLPIHGLYKQLNIEEMIALQNTTDNLIENSYYMLNGIQVGNNICKLLLTIINENKKE